MGIPIALYALALAVRVALLLLYPDPAYPDSYYYVDVARALHAGQGFNVDFIWIFAEVGGKIPANPVLPIPSNGHWMPLASIVQVPFLFAFGVTPVAQSIVFAIVGALAAPMTWAIAREAGARRVVAVGAGVLAAVPALMAQFSTQPDNFALYQVLVTGALWLTARGLKGHHRSFAFAGLLVGLATLARNDGVLVGFVVALAFFWDRWLARRSRRAEAAAVRAAAEAAPTTVTGPGGVQTVVVRAGPTGPAAPPTVREPRIPWSAAIVCALLFVAVVAPWLARQLLVFGTISPSTASGRVLFIQSISEWDSITGDATLGYLLAQGLPALLWSRVLGLVAAVTIFSVLVGALFLVPFMVVGGWARRRSVDFGPFFAYAFVLFAFSAVVSAVHVPGGTFIHSAFALAPYSYILALEGVVVFVGWLGGRRKWDLGRATRVFVVGFVGLSVALGLWYGVGVRATWDSVRQQRLQVAAALDRLGVPATDRLMSIDAAGYKYFTGRGGVVLVNDPLYVIESVARAYDIRWLVLEASDSVSAMAPIINGESRPPWIGAPVFSIPPPPGAGGPFASVAVYPVCTVFPDERCGSSP